MTGTSNPCLSIFKPLFLGEKFIKNLIEPSGEIDNSFWWTAEKLHRLASKNYAFIAQKVHQEQAGLQVGLIEKVQQLIDNQATDEDFQKLSASAFHSHTERCVRLYEENKEVKANHFSPVYSWFWRGLTQATDLSNFEQ